MAGLQELLLQKILSGPAQAAAKAKVIIEHDCSVEFFEDGTIKKYTSKTRAIPNIVADVNLGEDS